MISVRFDSGCPSEYQVGPGQVIRVSGESEIRLSTPRGDDFFMGDGSSYWGLEVASTRRDRVVTVENFDISVDELRMETRAGFPPVLVFQDPGTYELSQPVYFDGQPPGLLCRIRFSGRDTPDPLQDRIGPRESFVQVLFDERSGFDWWDFYKADAELQQRGYELVRVTVSQDRLTYHRSPDGPVRLISVPDRSPMREAKIIEGMAEEMDWLHFRAAPIWLFELDL